MAETATAIPQRSRILAAALDLMAAHGVAGTSMRQLAKACHLNVASLYHYFPSKSDLLRAVIQERNYAGLMREVTIPVDRSLPPADRLAALLHTIWAETLAEEPVWRLLIGESLRGEPAALEVVRELAVELEAAVDRWLGDLFPELPPDHAEVSSVVTSQLLGYFLEHLILIDGDPLPRIDRRAAALGDVIFGKEPHENRPL